MARCKGSYDKFEGLPVKDAEIPMSIPLLQIDIDNAEQYQDVGINDPRRFKQCVVAQACGRMLGHGHVRINRTVAYLTWEGADHALRYELTPETRKIVEAFDRSKRSRAKIKPGQILTFDPPRLSNRLESMRSHALKPDRNRKNIGVRKSNRIDIELRHGAYAR